MRLLVRCERDEVRTNADIHTLMQESSITRQDIWDTLVSFNLGLIYHHVSESFEMRRKLVESVEDEDKCTLHTLVLLLYGGDVKNGQSHPYVINEFLPKHFSPNGCKIKNVLQYAWYDTKTFSKIHQIRSINVMKNESIKRVVRDFWYFCKLFHGVNVKLFSNSDQVLKRVTFDNGLLPILRFSEYPGVISSEPKKYL